MEWEDIGNGIDRAELPMGWLVTYDKYTEDGDPAGCGITFVPDPMKLWAIEYDDDGLEEI